MSLRDDGGVTFYVPDTGAEAIAAAYDQRLVDALGPHGRKRIIDAMVRGLRDWTDTDGALAVPSSCVIATAVSPR